MMRGPWHSTVGSVGISMHQVLQLDRRIATSVRQKGAGGRGKGIWQQLLTWKAINIIIGRPRVMISQSPPDMSPPSMPFPTNRGQRWCSVESTVPIGNMGHMLHRDWLAFI